MLFFQRVKGQPILPDSAINNHRELMLMGDSNVDPDRKLQDAIFYTLVGHRVIYIL